MPHESLVHATRTFERTFSVPVSRLFRAWESPDERALWGAPDPAVSLRYHAADFTPGGEDVCNCVVGDQVVATVRTRWLDVTPPRRIVATETIADLERVQGVSLFSVELLPDGPGSRLVLTLQTVAFDGSGLERDVVVGWSAALDHLERLVTL